MAVEYHPPRKEFQCFRCGKPQDFQSALEMSANVVEAAKKWSGAQNNEEHWAYRRMLREAIAKLRLK